MEARKREGTRRITPATRDQRGDLDAIVGYYYCYYCLFVFKREGAEFIVTLNGGSKGPVDVRVCVCVCASVI